MCRSEKSCVFSLANVGVGAGDGEEVDNVFLLFLLELADFNRDRVVVLDELLELNFPF